MKIITIGDALMILLLVWLIYLVYSGEDTRVPEGYTKLCTILPNDHTLVKVQKQLETTGGYTIDPNDPNVKDGRYYPNINNWTIER